MSTLKFDYIVSASNHKKKIINSRRSLKVPTCNCTICTKCPIFEEMRKKTRVHRKLVPLGTIQTPNKQNERTTKRRTTESPRESSEDATVPDRSRKTTGEEPKTMVTLSSLNTDRPTSRNKRIRCIRRGWWWPPQRNGLSKELVTARAPEALQGKAGQKRHNDFKVKGKGKSGAQRERRWPKIKSLCCLLKLMV